MLIFGVSPLVIRSSTGTNKIFAHRWAIAYAIFFNTILATITALLFICRFQPNDLSYKQIPAMANLLQGSTCAILHFILIACCLLYRERQITFFNDIVAFDTKLLQYLRTTIVDERSVVLGTSALHFLFSFGTLATILSFGDVVHFFKPYWYNWLWFRVFACMLAVQCLVLLHVRFGAMLLTKRFHRICRQLFETDSDDGERICRLLELANDLNVLNSDFENCFGLVILVNTIIDLLVLTVSIYMTILYALETKRMTAFGMTVMVFALPIAKESMFVSAVNGLGNQVNNK